MRAKPEPSITGFIKNGKTGLLSIKQAAEYLNISSRTIVRHINSREIAFIKVFGQYRFRPEDLERFIENNRTPSLAEQKRAINGFSSGNF